jgi:hypothetical protein
MVGMSEAEYKHQKGRTGKGDSTTHAYPGPAGSSRPVAAVTGASAGIGSIFARKLAARGYDLILTARNEQRLAELARRLKDEHGAAAEVAAADLTREADREKVAEILRGCERLELLVNNAGFGTTPRFVEADLGRQLDMARLHVLAVAHLTHAALRGMLARGRGGVINVSSVAGFFQSPSNVMYCSTKAWLNSFTEGLAVELEGSGVSVQSLCPGFTYSEFHDRMGVGREAIPASWWLRPEFVVEQSLRGLERGELLVVPAARYKLVVMASKLLPRRLRVWMARRRHTRLRRTGMKSQM